MPFFDFDMAQFQALAHVAIAMGLGGVIGLEREFTGKAAGLRTHMLVAGASAIFVSLGTVVVEVFRATLETSTVTGDPMRIVHGVVTGIGFLGAGSIITSRESERVSGLTTAASIWFVAAIGVSVALSQIILAVGSTVLGLIALRCLHVAEERFRKRRQERLNTHKD